MVYFTYVWMLKYLKHYNTDVCIYYYFFLDHFYCSTMDFICLRRSTIDYSTCLYAICRFKWYYKSWWVFLV